MKKTHPAIERLVENARQLHSLPAVAMEVLELTNNPVVDAQALKKCIERDPALTGKLLRVVNSSLFGLAREVSDLNQALALLGTKPLKLLVLGFSLPSGLFGRVDASVLERYWRHSLTKAVAAREISQTIWNRSGDDVFIAGLLQDIGEMILIEELGRPYVAILEKSFCGGAELRRLEIEAMGFEHTELTSRLLEHWNLPSTLVRSVRRQVDAAELAAMSPAEKAERRILHLAELTARLLADGDTSVLGQLIESGRNDHNLSKHRLDVLVSELEEKVDNLAEVLSLRLGGGLNGEGYRDILQRAHAQLAAAAAGAAEDMLAARLGIDADARSARAPEAMALADELRTLSTAVKEISNRGKVQHASARVESACKTKSFTAGGETSAMPSATITTGAAGTSRMHSLRNTAAVAAADPALTTRLAAAVASCRQARCPLSLLLVELNNVEELIFSQGMDNYLKARRLLLAACNEVDHEGATCVPLGEASAAVILPDCDRRDVAAPSHEIIEAVAEFAGGQNFSSPGAAFQPPVLSVGIGAATVAMPPKNFPPQSLIESAARCLYGSLCAGGGVLKSIEIY